MKNFKKLMVMAFAVSLFSAVGILGATPKVEKTLEQKIHSQILSLPNYGVFDTIGFEIDGTTVTLTGKLYNSFNKKAAQKRVEKIEGVEKVINNIELLPPSGFDDRIRRNALRTFSQTGGVYRFLIGPRPSVRIIVENGRLTLVGNVATEGDFKTMGILAKGLSGVFSVTNDLTVNKKL